MLIILCNYYWLYTVVSCFFTSPRMIDMALMLQHMAIHFGQNRGQQSMVWASKTHQHQEKISAALIRVDERISQEATCGVAMGSLFSDKHRFLWISWFPFNFLNGEIKTCHNSFCFCGFIPSGSHFSWKVARWEKPGWSGDAIAVETNGEAGGKLVGRGIPSDWVWGAMEATKAGSGVFSSPFLRTSGSLQVNSWILIFLKTSQLLDALIMFDFRNGTPRAPTTRQLNRYGAVFCSSCTKVRANMMVCKRPNINAYSTICVCMCM